LFRTTKTQLNGEDKKKNKDPAISILNGTKAFCISVPQIAIIKNFEVKRATAVSIKAIKVRVFSDALTDLSKSFGELPLYLTIKGYIAFIKNVGITSTNSNILYARLYNPTEIGSTITDKINLSAEIIKEFRIRDMPKGKERAITINQYLRFIDSLFI